MSVKRTESYDQQSSLQVDHQYLLICEWLDPMNEFQQHVLTVNMHTIYEMVEFVKLLA